jgi:signal transduction histidine kinase
VASAIGAAIRRLGRDIAFLVVGAVLGGVWLIVVGLAATVLLVLLGGLVGAPIAGAVLGLVRRLGDLERRMTNRRLRIAVPPVPAMPREGDARARLTALALAGSTWRAAAWLVLRQPLALLVGTVVGALAWFAASLALAPFTGALVGAGLEYQASALVAAVACVLLIVQSLWLSSEAHARLAFALLGPSVRDEVAALQRRTAELDLRAGLARDLHDLVGHSVTASLLQASAARRALERDPAFAARALEAIEDQSRAALEQLDRVLGTLRDGRTQSDDGRMLDSIDQLLTSSRTAGIALTVERRGDLGHVPATVSREAFRIVQEGLTNVLRHASGASARVLLERSAGSLEVVVENRRGVSLDDARSGGGEGIRGIAERAGSLGGELAYGPLPDGGFRLRVRLPFDTA